jgi:hypothetical protein
MLHIALFYEPIDVWLAFYITMDYVTVRSRKVTYLYLFMRKRIKTTAAATTATTTTATTTTTTTTTTTASAAATAATTTPTNR